MDTHEVVCHPLKTTRRSIESRKQSYPQTLSAPIPHPRIRKQHCRGIIGALLGQLKPKTPNRDFRTPNTRDSLTVQKRINTR